MLKIALNCIMYLCAIYCIGDNIRRNPKIDAFLAALEGGYTRINQHLENATVRSGLAVMRKIYGWTSLVMFCVFAVLTYSLPSWKGAMDATSQLFMLTFMFWMSIKWAVDHKVTLIEHWKTYSLLISAPLLMGLCDTLLDSGFTRALVIPFAQFPLNLHIDITALPPLFIGGFYSALFLVFFVSYYLMTWVITTPVLIISVLTIAIPIIFCRLLAAIDREKTFLWFAVFTGGACMLWLTQL